MHVMVVMTAEIKVENLERSVEDIARAQTGSEVGTKPEGSLAHS